MQIFGDQSWKKIMKFLIIEEKESKKSKTISKVKTTFRSVKAIQSKIYQIKKEVEAENNYIKDNLMKFDSTELRFKHKAALLEIKKGH